MMFFNKENKTTYIKKNFNQIATKYDFFNDIITFGMHRLWKKKIAKSLRYKEYTPIIDLCCGTGDIAKYIEQYKYKQNNKAEIIGIDFSKEMIQLATKKKKSTDKRTFILGNVAQLDYSNNSIGAVTIGFGLRNVVEREQLLREIYKILRKGGKFLCLETGEVSLFGIKNLFHMYFFFIVPFFGKCLKFPKEFYQYLPQSTLNYPTPQKIISILENIGFKNVQLKKYIFGGVVIHTAEK